jgi:hypothetical protein
MVSRAELFLSQMSSAISGAPGGQDLEDAVRRIASNLNAEIAAGRLDRILDAIEDVLDRQLAANDKAAAMAAGRPQAPRGLVPRTSAPGCDPFYWG